MYFRRNFKNLKRSDFRHVIVTVFAFAVLGLFTAIALNVSFLNPVSRVVKEFSVTDIFYQILRDTGEPEKSHAITIVDMSDLYSRRDIARCIREVESMHPKTVGMDILFEGPKDDIIGDGMMMQVAADFNNIVCGCRMVNLEGGEEQFERVVHSFFMGADSLSSAAAADTLSHGMMEGFTNIPRGLYGNMKRNVSVGRRLNGVVVPSFATQVVNHYVGREVIAVQDRDLHVNFSPMDFNIVSHDSIARHPELIEGRLVLLGSLTDEADMHYTPVGKMPGVQLLAYAAQTLLEQKEVKTLPAWLLAIVSFLLVMVTQMIHSRYSEFALSRKSHFWKNFLHAAIMFSFITFIWMSFLTWVAFFIFCKTDVNVNLGWAFGAFAFLLTGRELYKAIWK